MEKSELTAQARSALATRLLIVKESMTTGELAECLGVTNDAVYPIMDNIGMAGIPILKPEYNRWAIDRDWVSRELSPAIINARTRGVPELE